MVSVGVGRRHDVQWQAYHCDNPLDMPTQHLLTVDIWPTLARMTADSGTIRAAIAYVTAEHLQLKKNDILVCDASDKSIRGGLTDADTLANFVEAQVKVFSIKGLHVKMGTFERYAFIGSANMSANAGTRTLEATLLTSDVQVRNMVAAHIEQLVENATRVDACFIERIRRLPVSPRTSPWPEYDGPPQVASARPSQVWWLSSSPLGSRSARALHERLPRVARGAVSELRNDASEEVRQATEEWDCDPGALELMVYPASHKIPQALQRGDTIIFCNKGPSGEFKVSPPATFLTTQTVDNHQHVVYLSDTNATTRKWATVGSKLEKLGSTIKPTSNRTLRGPELDIQDFLAGTQH